MALHIGVMSRTPSQDPSAPSAAVEEDDAPIARGATKGPLDDRLGFWLRLAQMTAFDMFNQAMSPLSLTPGRLGALLLIEAGTARRQTDLAEALRVKPPNMAVLLGGLEQEGLIRRVEDARNRRANILRLTPAGRALLRKAREREAAMETELASGLDATERAALITALRRIAERR